MIGNLCRARFTVPAVLTLVLVCRSPAQDVFAARLAKQVQLDAAVLSSRPTIAAWQRSHATEKLELAHYGLDNEPYEIDFERLNRWCAASLSRSLPAINRTAFFYVPSVEAGALPAA